MAYKRIKLSAYVNEAYCLDIARQFLDIFECYLRDARESGEKEITIRRGFCYVESNTDVRVIGYVHDFLRPYYIKYESGKYDPTLTAFWFEGTYGSLAARFYRKRVAFLRNILKAYENEDIVE